MYGGQSGGHKSLPPRLYSTISRKISPLGGLIIRSDKWLVGFWWVFLSKISFSKRNPKKFCFFFMKIVQIESKFSKIRLEFYNS